MGLPNTLDIKGQGIVQAVKKLEEAQKDFPHIDFSTLYDLSQLETFISEVNLFDVQFPQEVENNSELSWYTSPTGGYVMLLPEKERITISQNLLDKWEINATIKSRKYKGERDSIEEAFSAADSLVQDKCFEAMTLLRREEKWHNDPPTPKQLKRLMSMYKGKPLPLDLDKGKASRLISSYLANKEKK
jgi:hypothetical protein